MNFWLPHSVSGGLSYVSEKLIRIRNDNEVVFYSISFVEFYIRS